MKHSKSHKIVGGRHPMVTIGLEEQGRTFVSNDCFVGDTERIWLITGYGFLSALGIPMLTGAQTQHGGKEYLPTPERSDFHFSPSWLICTGGARGDWHC